jgi:hypothetical protein
LLVWGQNFQESRIFAVEEIKDKKFKVAFPKTEVLGKPQILKFCPDRGKT